MASSLPLVMSVPDPDENSSRASDGQETPASDQPKPIMVPVSDSAEVALSPDTHDDSSSEDIFAVLQRSIADESQPPDAVIRATTEAARVLTAADGVAVAFRNKGVILCRARSGELAPDLGSYVNANTGISGECLRTASILVCHDARVDARVDNLVCERMGIRSIVVVPLRGPVGISGILEVFSSRANAFGNREINCLRRLAVLAEAAYERERLLQQEAIRAALRSAHRLPAIFQRSVANESESPDRPQGRSEFQTETADPRPERFIWVIGVAAVALLMMVGVWLSWHGPISELAELEAAENHNSVQAAPPPKEAAVSPKPTPGIVRAQDQKPSHSNTTRKADEAQDELDSAPLVLSRAKTSSNAENSSLSVQAPAVDIDARANQNEFASLLPGQGALPVMAAPISRGVSQGELIRKVDPVYPLQAREDRIAGSVVLEISVGTDGMVRGVKALSGNPQLAGAAIQAVRQWRYTPTLLNGHPIEATKQITVLFKLP